MLFSTVSKFQNFQLSALHCVCFLFLLMDFLVQTPARLTASRLTSLTSARRAEKCFWLKQVVAVWSDITLALNSTCSWDKGSAQLHERERSLWMAYWNWCQNVYVAPKTFMSSGKNCVKNPGLHAQVAEFRAVGGPWAQDEIIGIASKYL